MTCPSEATVAGFLERRLSSEQCAAIDEHVDACASCRRVLIDMIPDLQLVSMVADAHATLPARQAGDGGTLARGTTVGRFVVVDVLGSGGMGVVYTAYDPELDRKVALKLLRPGGDAGGTRALLVEAQAMARICHASVIAVYDVGTYREQVFAAMELVEGTTLRRWIAERPRTWREVVGVFLLAGEGLAAAHAAHLVHRDFKPENVLLGADGRVKVSDFGLATGAAVSDAQLAGTPGYLAAEAFQGRVDERSDQFSFCVALHEALHGKRPFAAGTRDELVAAIRRGPALVGTRVPRWLDRVVRRGLALVPEDRYPSMRALIAELRRVVAAHRMRRAVAAAVAALAVVVVATAALVHQRTTASQRCADAADQLAGVWDPARREAVRHAFARAATPFAAGWFDRVSDVLDRYAVAWTAMRTEACEAEARREQPALSDLRMACLDRARIQLRALGDELVHADATAVRDAVGAAGALPALRECSDADALRAIISPPLASAARTQVSSASATQATPAIDPVRIARDAAARPEFRLPFGCGEAWQLSHRAEHAHAGKQVDFYLPGEVPSGGFAVYASSPGWVSHVDLENGQVDVNHGEGWFTTYQHMTDIAVAPRQYVSRGHALGKVGNRTAWAEPDGAGPPHLHYEQIHHPGIASPDFEREADAWRQYPYLEGQSFNLAVAGTQVRTSSNGCVGGGAPGSATQYDVPSSTAVFSRSIATQEIMTRRAEDHALFERWFDGEWHGARMPHTIAGQPAVALFNSELHVIARSLDGTLFDFRYNPFSGWKTTFLEGKVSDNPDVAIYGRTNDLHVAARGKDGLLYHWSTSGGAWTAPARVSPMPVIGTPAVIGHYDTFYIIARAADGALVSWKTDRRGPWRQSPLGGAAGDDPDVAIDPQSGRVNVVARGLDNRLRRWQSLDLDRADPTAGDGWTAADVIDDRPVTGTPAAFIYHGAMHVIARTASAGTYHWWKDSAWRVEAIGDAFTGDIDTYRYGYQLQAVGRSTDGTLRNVWYDAPNGTWNQEHHDLPIAD